MRKVAKLYIKKSHICIDIRYGKSNFVRFITHKIYFYNLLDLCYNLQDLFLYTL